MPAARAPRPGPILRDEAPGRDWKALHRQFLRRCAADGLDRSTPAEYLWRGLFVSVVFLLATGTLLLSPSWPGRLVALCCAMFAAFHGGLLSHDLTHRNVTSGRRATRVLGQWFMSTLTGQTYGHWEWKHLKHHEHTQDTEHDPDLAISWFALHRADARRKAGIYRFTTRHQHLLVWPMITFQVFAIRHATVKFVLSHPRRSPLDAVGLVAHVLVWLVLPIAVLGPAAALANYFLYTWMMGPYAAASFLWNHVGAPVAGPADDLPYFVQRVDGSRNLRDSPVLNFLFGGLNFHVEHHLAPNLPSARLPAARRLFTALLAEHGLPYREWGYFEAMGDIYRHFREVAREVEAPALEREPAGEASLGLGP